MSSGQLDSRQPSPPQDTETRPDPPPASWRERIAERLADRPVLRLLALNPLFSAIVFLMLLAVLSVGALLPKVWRTTPPGFHPVVRVSLLDLLQAWSLQRTASKQVHEGQLPDAAKTFFSAAKNNLGDADLLRRALETFIQAGLGPRSPLAQRASELAPWLLHLTRTNQNDLFLVARFYDALGDSLSVMRLLEPLKPEELPQGLYGAMAKALFDMGNAQAFGQWWERIGKQENDDPALALYRAAYLAGWGPPEQQAAHRAQIEQAARQLDTRLLANRLLLRITQHQNDLAGYQQALQRLESFRGDRLQEHVDYWFMLRRAGRSEEALQLARNYPYPPRHALEAAQLGQALVQLGDPEAARKLLERYGPTLGDGPAQVCLPLWALLGDLYIAGKDWQALARMGQDIRSLPRGNATMSGFGWFAEGRALVGLGERDAADQAFEQAVRAGFTSARMAVEIAGLLLQLNFPRHALHLLVPVESSQSDNVRYWQALFEAAYALHEDEAMLLKAARRALDLEPENPIRRVNYAVALLINRQRPEEATRLTLEFFHANRSSSLARLNHAHALAMVGRTAEAVAMMQSLPPPTDPAMVSARALVFFEIAVRRSDVSAAEKALARIDRSLSFPSQRVWMDQQIRKLGLRLPLLRPNHADRP